MNSKTSALPLLLWVLLTFVQCSYASCEFSIVESMPDGLDLEDPVDANVVRTHVSLLDMIDKTTKSLRIASFYWYLTPPAEFNDHPASEPGKQLMEAIAKAVERGVQLEIALDGSSRSNMNNANNVRDLQKMGTVKFVNMTRLAHGGVMHTKFLISDNQTFYLGSSNFDWRSYTEIKEMGVTFKGCYTLASDLDRIFRTYMLLADANQVPDKLSDDLKTKINLQNPLEMEDVNVFLAGSPPAFNGKDDWTGRTDDIDALLHVIDSAKHRISISVMNYSPRMEFVWPKRYWPRIDDALRRAATTRHVKVELLFSNWSSTRSSELAWYKSLNCIQSSDFHQGGIHVKLFKVPAFDDFQKRIPFARVKHDKFMVTDGAVYLGTSNWTPDYFVSTAGVSLIIRPKISRNAASPLPKVIQNFQNIFDRDFNSKFAHDLQY